MESSTGGGLFSRRVMLLKESDCKRLDGNILMPTTIDMAKLRKPSTGQYKEVQFSKCMSEEVVRQSLQGAFPLFNLSGRFYCAYISQESIAFKFHGNRRVWDGKTIRKTVRGNSVLYILLDNDKMSQESHNTTGSSSTVAFQQVNQPVLTSSGRNSAILMQNNEQSDAFQLQRSNMPWSSTVVTNSNFSEPQNLTAADFSRAKNGALQGVIGHPENQQISMVSSTVTSQTISQDSWDIACQQLQPQSPAEAMESSNQILTKVTVVEGLNNWSSDPVVSSGFSLTDSPSQGTGENGEAHDTIQNSPFHIMSSPSLPFILKMSDSTGEFNSSSGMLSTSGISGSENDFSQEDLIPHDEIPEDIQYDFSVSPQKVPLQGGSACIFTSVQMLPVNVRSGFALFEQLDSVGVRRWEDDSLVGRKIPASLWPGWVKIVLKTENGRKLGETEIYYYDEEKEVMERIIKNPKLQENFFRKFTESLVNRNSTTDSCGEPKYSGSCGVTQPMQTLCLLVYLAAEIGGQQFIKMIFNSSAGRIVFEHYKDRSPLPEAVARENGNEETAKYLENITNRLSEEHKIVQNCSQPVFWSELVKAAQEAQKHLGLGMEEVKDNGYLGDVEASSNESCGSSDSEDNISATPSAEINRQADVYIEQEWMHKVPECGLKKPTLCQSLMSFCEKGNFNRDRVNSTISHIILLSVLEDSILPSFHDNFIREVHSLKHLRGLVFFHNPFFLNSEKKHFRCYLVSKYEWWYFLFKRLKESNFHSQTYAAGGGQFEDHDNQETPVVLKAASISCAEDRPRTQSPEELEISDSVELADEWNTSQGSTKHSTFSNLWVLTCLNRPARNVLFVYLADNSDDLPHEVYFDDDKHELSTQCWQWQRCSSSLFDVQNRLHKMRKVSELMRPEVGPNPLSTCSAKLSKVQGQHMLSLPKYCPTWLYTMLHQCCVYAPVERPPFIAIFDGISSRTPGACSVVTLLCQHNLERSLPRNECPLEYPCLVNLSKNYPSSKVDKKFWFEDVINHILTVSSYDLYLRKDLREPSNGGWDISTSPTAFALIINVDSKYLGKDAVKGLVEDLPMSMSLTAFTLTTDNDSKCLAGDWGKDLAEGLTKCTPLTTFTLTNNAGRGCLGDDWGKGLGEGLARSLSLTAFTLSIDDGCGYLGGNWGKHLSDGLARSTSLTSFTLRINNGGGYMDEEWGKGLGEGLARSASLTTFTLTMNDGCEYPGGDWIKDLSQGLAKSKSMTTFILTFSNGCRYVSRDWVKGLAESLAKSNSLNAFTLTFNDSWKYVGGNWGKCLTEGLARSTSLTAFTLRIDNGSGYLSGDWGKGLGEGLANSTSLTVFTLTINDRCSCLGGDWVKGLGEGLAQSRSLISFTLLTDENPGCFGGDGMEGLGQGLAKSTSLTVFTLTIDDSGRYLYGDWGKGLGKGLANSTSLTVFNLTFKYGCEYLGGDWGKCLGEGLAKSTSLTAFNVTFKCGCEYLGGDWGKCLGEGLAKSTSLTAFTLTFEDGCGYLDVNWGKALSEGLANCTSLTTFTLTFKDGCEYQDGDCGKGLAEGLAKSSSLSSFNLTINDGHRYLGRDWGKGLGESLAQSTSLAAFTLTFNDGCGYLGGDWGNGLGEGLAKSNSLTTFALTFNDGYGYLGGDWGKCLGEGLAKSTSLSAFTLTINAGSGYLGGDWGKGLGEGLAKSTSLTAFTLSINFGCGYLDGDWGKGLGRGLAKSTSLTAFTLTVNDGCGYLGGDWGKDLGEALAKSTSLIAFTLTINNGCGYLGGDWGKGLGEGLARSTSLTAFTLTINAGCGYLGGDWGKGLGEGLAKSMLLTAFSLTINFGCGYLGVEWGIGLGEGLAKSSSLTSSVLTINDGRRYLGGAGDKGMGEGLTKGMSLAAFTSWLKGLGRSLGSSKSF